MSPNLARPCCPLSFPFSNEVGGLAAVFERLSTVSIPHEIIAVHDGSTDGTRNAIEAIAPIHEGIADVVYGSRLMEDLVC